MGPTAAVVRVAGAVVLGALLVAGCSNATSRFNTVGNRINPTSASDQAGSGAGTSAELAGGRSRPKGPAVGTQVDERDVIYTGSLRVRVDDAVKAAESARAVAEDAGGYLARQDAQLDDERQVSLTLRVPADEFDSTMAAVARLGKVQGRKVDSEDVTSQVVDVEGRLENARTSAQRLRELLAKAENVQNVVTIEERLTQRETEIESLAGSLEVLKDQVELATVRVTLTEKDEAKVNKDLPGPLEALRSGGIAFVNVALFIVVALAFSLPFLVTALVLWRLYRRWRRAHPRPRPPAPAGFVPLPAPPVPAPPVTVPAAAVDAPTPADPEA